MAASDSEAKRLARAWIEGWNAGAPDDIPLADDFVHHSPLGVYEGRARYLEKVKPLSARNVVSLKILRILGEGREAAIWYEVTTPDGVMQACDWVQTDDGRITRIDAFYDATGLRRKA